MTLQKATFAGGCFWCMVKPFDRYEGVQQVISGYTGGNLPNPTYEQVCTNVTGHREAVEITFDDDLISYKELLDIFWKQIDPTDATGQFYDRGESYQTAIFTHNKTQRQLAEKSKQDLEESNRFAQPIATEILDAKPFYKAEEGHQNYYQKNPLHYKRYSIGSGREDFINKHWEGERE